MESIWLQDTDIKPRPSLPGDMTVEAAVIGGGMAGILTAYFLQRQGVQTVVLEAAHTGSGQTQNTTAKITSQHNLIYDKLLHNFGREKAAQYARANEQAIGEYRRIITENKIDCSFEERPAYLYSTSADDVPDLRREAAAAQKLGIAAEYTPQLDLPLTVAGAVRFDGQAQFHPLKFLQAIASELTIYEMTGVKDVNGNQINTDRGGVTARHIVFAAHFPFINMPGFYFARMHQERSYVLALEGAQLPEGMYLGIDKEGLSLRSYHNLVLLGGGKHRAGENSAGGKYAFLRQAAARLYPESRETAHWSAQDCMTLDGVPYIGKFCISTPNWYVATGFGKWGMTGSMVSALLISGMITGKENAYAEVFSPQRFTPAASVKAMLTESGQAVKGLARQVLLPARETIDKMPAGHGGVVESEGEKAGVYKDEQGLIFAVATRCPHLGCQLEWNPDEKSWDCPCHGSRFNYRGDLLDNPAQEGLQMINHE